MPILNNGAGFYDPTSGFVYVIKNDKFQTQSIPFADTYEDMKTKQKPTIVKPMYVDILRQHLVDYLAATPALGNNVKVKLSMVENDPAFGTFKFTVTTGNGPEVVFSVSELAFQYNTDPVQLVLFKRYIFDAFNVLGYQF